MEHVEALLALASDQARAWPPGDVAARTHTSLASVTACLDRLVAAGLASPEGSGQPPSYRYAPRSQALRGAVESVEEMYRTKPVTLIKAIYDRPATAVQSFADAFRIRKPDA